MQRRLMVGAAIAALAASPLVAQDRPAPAPGGEAPAARQSAPDGASRDMSSDVGAAHPSILSGQRDSQRTADQLIGTSVVNAAGEAIGKVDDLVIGNDGRVAGVVVSIGGVMGIGAKSIGIAWNEVSFDADGNVKIDALTAEELEAAPEFEKASDAASGSMLGDSPATSPQRLTSERRG